MKRIIPIAFLTLLASVATAQDSSSQPPKIRIVLAGDSTTATASGWGDGFMPHLAANIECINMARGGRSSKSFINEGLWKQCLALKPDYVLIQFGHNDQPGHPGNRQTDPNTTYRQFMTQYVDDAIAAGIQPVLVTSLSRRQWGADGKIHSTLVPYVEVVKEIAAEKKVPLIDLHALSIALYERIGKAGCEKLSPLKVATTTLSTGKSDDERIADSATAARVYDGTHLNAEGSCVIGAIVAEQLRQAVPALAPYIHVDAGAGKEITVAADGAGDFKTIQEAIAAAPENSTQPVVIKIKAGTYQGPVVVPENKPNLHFEGDGSDKTILTWDRNVHDPIPLGSNIFNPGVQILGNDFEAEKLTIENTSGDHGQALALRIDSDRDVLRSCRITGWQDTLMVNNGRAFFKDCYIEGRVDFIYGSATAVFDHCEIHSKNGGHVTAASTPQDHPFGFVFLHCNLTGDGEPWNPATTNPTTTLTAHKPGKMADLGRPWRPYASVAYIECEMGDHIMPAGWNNWRNAANEKTARYCEYNSTGPGADPDKRVKWSHQLTADEAAKFTIPNIFGGTDGWNPAQNR